MLSNTATPKYYGIFRDAVMRGEFPINELISMEMNRIDKLIRDPSVYCDPEPVEGWIDFCESELTLTDGSPLVLLFSFKLWAEQLLCWYTFSERSAYVQNPDGHGGHYVRKTVKKRLITKQYLIVARGNAKTLYASCHQSYGLTVDLSTTHQVASAPTLKQGEEMVAPIRTAISKRRGPLFKFLTDGNAYSTKGVMFKQAKLLARRDMILNKLTGSFLEVRSMSIAKLQGLQNKYSTVDEWLSGDIKEDIMGALEQGASKLNDYVIIATSSEGTIRNGIGDTIKLELMDILKGDYNAPNVSIWWYKLDDIKEIGNPEMWIKANPNIGYTVSYDTLQQEVERAENAPAARNDIIAKRFGIPMEGFTYFFTYEETLPQEKKRSYWSMRCSLGIDLSRGDDFCAFTFLFPLPRGYMGIKCRSYISEKTLFALPVALRLKYQEFIDEGTLFVFEGVTLDFMAVYDDLDQYIVDNHYEVCTVGYDPWGAKEFVERWEKENGSYGVEKVRQGTITESIPIGEISKLSQNGMLLFDESIMSFTMGNAVVLQDTNGNRKLVKRRDDEKIDNVSALIDAYVAWKRFPDAFE